jgi:hypothetical protein
MTISNTEQTSHIRRELTEASNTGLMNAWELSDAQLETVAGGRMQLPYVRDSSGTSGAARAVWVDGQPVGFYEP